MKIKHNNSMSVRVLALFIGFIINVIGNSLTVVSSQGAEPVTAAAQNLSKVTGASIGSFIIIFGIVSALTNQIILSHDTQLKLNKYQEHRRRIKDLSTINQRTKERNAEFWERLSHTIVDKGRFIFEIFYIFVFGFLIDWTVLIFDKMHLDQLDTKWSIVLSIFGVTLFCIGISIYQRANLFMHPNDDTSNLIRFRFLYGSALWSQLIIIVPALIICGLCYLPLGHIYGIGIGTIYSIVCNGIIVGLSDKFIWPHLKHNKQKLHNFKLSFWY